MSASPEAIGIRRAVAVFVDFVVFFAIWTAIGFVAPTGSLFYTLAAFLVLDIVMTAFIGRSPGRFAAGIRVVRDIDGGPPGLRAALIRTVIVLLTGWAGLYVYLLQRRYVGGGAPRMWWDAAAGTRITRASAPAPK